MTSPTETETTDETEHLRSIADAALAVAEAMLLAHVAVEMRDPDDKAFHASTCHTIGGLIRELKGQL